MFCFIARILKGLFDLFTDPSQTAIKAHPVKETAFSPANPQPKPRTLTSPGILSLLMVSLSDYRGLQGALAELIFN